jgi:hypothetical protein
MESKLSRVTIHFKERLNWKIMAKNTSLHNIHGLSEKGSKILKGEKTINLLVFSQLPMKTWAQTTTQVLWSSVNIRVGLIFSTENISCDHLF